MTPLELRFRKVLGENPRWTTYKCFCMAVVERDLPEVKIVRAFNKLVDKEDYLKDKEEGLYVAIRLSKNGHYDKHMQKFFLYESLPSLKS